MDIEELPPMAKVPQVAAFLGISPAQAWRMVWSGALPAVRISSKTVRIRRTDLEAWIAERPAAAAVA